MIFRLALVFVTSVIYHLNVLTIGWTKSVNVSVCVGAYDFYAISIIIKNNVDGLKISVRSTYLVNLLQFYHKIITFPLSSYPRHSVRNTLFWHCFNVHTSLFTGWIVAVLLLLKVSIRIRNIIFKFKSFLSLCEPFILRI